MLKLSYTNIYIYILFYNNINHLNIHRNCVFKSCALVDFGYVATLGITYVDCKMGKLMHTILSFQNHLRVLKICYFYFTILAFRCLYMK